MKLSTRSTYGVRMMALLATSHGRGPVLLKEVAERERISEKYLSQIVIPLRSAGLLRSVRGAHGGYALAREPGQITVREIVEVLEGGLDLVDPQEERDEPPQATDRTISRMWKRLSGEMVRTLDSITLGDIVVQANEDAHTHGTYSI